MTTINEIIMKISLAFSTLEEIEGVVLSGSLTTETQDEFSDIDLYIYSDHEISPSRRKDLLEPFSAYMEINNQYWETEDDGTLRDPKIGIEIIYRNYAWIENELNNSLISYNAQVGFSTCFWSNYLNSEILFDKHGRLKKLQDRVNVPYPVELKQNIINKNYPLLKDSITSYFHQIEKAVKRQDYISINHRVAALLASYFDIIFAINDLPHPGEKKLIKIAKQKCEQLPVNMEEDINNILRNNTSTLLDDIHKLVDRLDVMLESKNLLPKNTVTLIRK
ncbi:nucleotidyltransferase domain-containing protein [Halalkalibacter alkalisediminis]|uniref:Nucleotidyltransferase domain-containing protein n=1 Tax=Halalkalibacter alkalisediminis TaxID=935616 RepID=A0ABV6NNF3_9BACI|nr:nucleotidyltransferase domain-containing protein [Halalkalibacter alkalisediminis]